MRKALSIMEVALLGTLVCIISLAGFAIFNNVKLGLAKMSKTTAETAGSLAYGDDSEDVNVDNCVKNPDTNLCKVYLDNKGNRYVFIETTGTSGETWIQYLGDDTTSQLEGCIGQLAMNPLAVCFDAKGKQVKCAERNPDGTIKSVLIGLDPNPVPVIFTGGGEGSGTGIGHPTSGEGYSLPEGYIPAAK